MCVNCEEVRACWIAASDNKVCSDVTLVAEEMLLEHGHTSDNAGLAAGGECV